MLALKFDEERDADSVQDFCLQTEFDDLFRVRLDDSVLDVGLKGGNALALIVLGQNFKFSLQIVVVDDFDLHRFLVSQEACAVL